MKIFSRKVLIFFLVLLKTKILGIRQNRLIEAVLTSTQNLCVGAKIRKKVYPCKLQFFYIKVGFNGVHISRTCLDCFPDAFLSIYKVQAIFLCLHSTTLCLTTQGKTFGKTPGQERN